MMFKTKLTAKFSATYLYTRYVYIQHSGKGTYIEVVLC